MSETKTTDPWKPGCARQFLFAIMIFILMGFCYVGLIILSILFNLNKSQQDVLAVWGCIFIPVIMVAGVLIWGFFNNKRRSASLDAVFNKLGFTGRSYVMEGRQYHGVVYGRQVDVYFYRGPKLDIYISANFNTRLGIGLKGRYSHFQSGVLNRPELITHDPDLAHLGVYPLDDHWSSVLVENPVAKASILALTTSEAKSEYRNLQFQPEALFVQLHRFKYNLITPERIQSWLSECFALINIAESLPPPTVTAATLEVERRSRSDRSGFTMLIALITVGVIAFFAVIIIIFAIILKYISRGG